MTSYLLPSKHQTFSTYPNVITNSCHFATIISSLIYHRGINSVTFMGTCIHDKTMKTHHYIITNSTRAWYPTMDTYSTARAKFHIFTSTEISHMLNIGVTGAILKEIFTTKTSQSPTNASQIVFMRWWQISC